MPTSLFPALQEQWIAIRIPGEKPRKRVLMLWIFKKIYHGTSCLPALIHAQLPKHTSMPGFVSIPHQAESSFCLESLLFNV